MNGKTSGKRGTFRFKAGPEAKARALRELRAQQKLHAADSIRRLQARDAREPGFIWGEMAADAIRRYEANYGPFQA